MAQKSTSGTDSNESQPTSSARIESVTLEGFRGSPVRLTVSFIGNDGKPSSSILFGENGSGKSSIVDAIEWACQGQVGRSASVKGAGRPALVNFATSSGSCYAEASLSTGHRLWRSGQLGEDEKWGTQGSAVPPVFQKAPMSLKRSDILRFLDTPPVQRGAIFIGHALTEDKEPSQNSYTPDQEALAEERHATKLKMRESAALLADKIGVSPPPIDANEIAAMISEKVYRGVSVQNRHRVTLAPAIQKLVNEIEDYREKTQELNGMAKRLRMPTGAAAARLASMQALLGEVGDWLTRSFLEVTQVGHVARIDATFGRISDVSLEVDVTLSNGAKVTPQQAFSEGYQDLIAFLYFLAVARIAGEQGQPKILILDDVLQSVDSGIRVTLMELVAKEFKDWQLLVTVHDRLWRSQLRDIFQRFGHPVTEIEIRRWLFQDGPHLSPSGMRPEESLREALRGGDPFTVCGIAGRLLEQISDRLSWTIPISVKRRRGDAYTLADLWPGVAKEMKRTSESSKFTEIERWMHLRNTVGAHYNEWADGVSWQEADVFGRSVLEFFDATHCGSCGQWVERIRGRTYSCRCGSIEINPL